MLVPAKKVKVHIVHLWRCSCCNRTSNSSVKPGATYGGRCPRSSNGMHRWVKER